MKEGMVKITLADGTTYNQKIECSESMDSDIVAVHVCLPRGDKPEKPTRKIDGDEFAGWYRDCEGFVHNSNRTVLTRQHKDLGSDVERLIAAAPDAMQVLIDFVNYWNSYLENSLVLWLRNGLNDLPR